MHLHLNLRPVIHILGLMLMALAAVMLIPLIVEQLIEGHENAGFEEGAIVTGFFGLLIFLASREEGELQLDLKQAFLLTALSWMVLPIFAAIPLTGVEQDSGVWLSFTDAVFETVSGITTTGSTVLSGLDHLSPGFLVWRSLLNWIGGIGIIVMAIVMLPFLRIGGMQLFRSESSDRSEKIAPNAGQIVAWITGVYAALTLVCAAAFYLTGMSGFDAINHAMATLATGGFSTHDASFGYFGVAAQWVAIVFMIAGALPFVAYIKFVRGRRRAFYEEPQVRAFLLFLFVVIVLGATYMASQSGQGFGEALTRVAFNVVSVVTTTGFATEDYSLWGTWAVAGFFLLMFVGGCAGSTSGAIKIYRFQVLWIILRNQLQRLTSPNRVIPLTFGAARVGEGLLLSVLAFMAAFFASVALITLLLALMDIDFVTALTAAATAITNVGPGLGTIIGPAGNFAPLPDMAKWLLCFAMLLGRLEIFVLFMLFDPHFWKD
ncbi:MAG: TrkH family potassium uptake protein [Alphaproteobacteria bacterium]|nr:TrkH family potassium uptake protein [Alphaproteobacteria bacterium]